MLDNMRFFLITRSRNLMALVLCMVCLWVATPSVAQNVSLKTNLFGDMTTSVCLSGELKLSSHVSLDVASSLNFWEFSNDRKFKHVLVQPAVRYWFCEYRNGWFVGAHTHWAHYNVGGIKLPFGIFPSLEKMRYQGDLWGGGASAGYSWVISRHFDVETELGLGYARFVYDKYPCRHCSMKSDGGYYNYWGGTKLAVNLVYSF